MLKPVLGVLLTAIGLFAASCNSTSYSPLDCSITPGVADLDATWHTYVQRNTLVTWPDSGDTEVREYAGSGLLTIDQCGNHAVVAKFMGGEAQTGGVSVFGDFEDFSYTSMGSLPFVVTAEGYIAPTSGWLKIKSDYGWVVYDSTYLIILQSRSYNKPSNAENEHGEYQRGRSSAVYGDGRGDGFLPIGPETPLQGDYR